MKKLISGSFQGIGTTAAHTAHLPGTEMRCVAGEEREPWEERGGGRSFCICTGAILEIEASFSLYRGFRWACIPVLFGVGGGGFFQQMIPTINFQSMIANALLAILFP